MEPGLVLAAISAVVGALAVFAALLLAGVRIVSALRLPTELPEGPRFEPAPPPAHAPGDPAAARARAALTARRRAVGDDAARAAEIAEQLRLRQEEVPDELRAPIAEAADEAARAAAVAETAFRGDDLDDAEATTRDARERAERALERAEHVLRDAPAPSQRHLVVLVALLVVAVAWLAAMLWWSGPTR